MIGEKRRREKGKEMKNNVNAKKKEWRRREKGKTARIWGKSGGKPGRKESEKCHYKEKK